ncbi:hypothetical protein EJ063_09205 [Vibrio aquaticus]|uniref:Phosphate ABC transporter substrate-binding protein n=1 Tax=Vibrio aquaticus TaxID=2496559 RepID=A0A3S0P6C8_9VIBR|nr:hypothetical protein [Vibrio aquaticus]RTZ15950.1 hypothetical protein EJ063_09205 [Vibrio aquaticus]
MRSFSLCLLLMTTQAFADIYVVVSEKSPMSHFEIEEVADVYLGRKKTLGSTYVDQVLDRTGEDRKRFFSAVTNMTESQVNAYWAKLKFSGSMRAPDKVSSDQGMLEKIIENPQAIGYMTKEPPASSGVRVGLHIHE